MLSTLHDCFDMVAEAFTGSAMTCKSMPSEDEAVYDILSSRPTPSGCSVESAGPDVDAARVRPRKFYDLVVEVALIQAQPRPEAARCTPRSAGGT